MIFRLLKIALSHLAHSEAQIRSNQNGEPEPGHITLKTTVNIPILIRYPLFFGEAGIMGGQQRIEFWENSRYLIYYNRKVVSIYEVNKKIILSYFRSNS